MLAIRVVSREGEAPSTPLAATFGDAGGDIGRGVDCTLVLPDPERRISRRHAVVSFRAGRHFIRQLGLHVAVEVDGTPLGPEAECLLEPGAHIRIGPYLMHTATEIDVDVPITTSGFKTAVPLRQSVDVELDGVIDRPLDKPLDSAIDSESAAQLAALYQGLGLPAPVQPSSEQTQLIGALLRTAIGGALQLLAVRTIAKRELGASPTLLQTRENNPLKFSPDVDAALSHLLGPVQRGFIPPLTAVQEAFDDLRAHEMAVLAGMRAALDAVLARFDPAALEERLAPKGFVESVLPAARKARLWERYGEQYAQMLREIEGDFDSLFARAFLQAYQAQMDQVRSARRV